MIILAMDDEKIALEGLANSIRKAEPNAIVEMAQTKEEVYDFMKESYCDVAFLDIEMRGMNGVNLAKKMKLFNPNMNIIFVTGYSQYATEAFEMHASGYIMKPVTRDKIRKELDNLRIPVDDTMTTKKVRAQTFGSFEVFIDDKPVHFQYNKTKEMLAYMIDRKGAFCSIGELMAILFEDECSNKKRSYMGNLCADLVNSFRKEKCENVVIRQRGKIAIDIHGIECDYFDWLDSKVSAINAYRGEYMSQYPWAEMTLGQLEQ